jgi:hypothetical protein
MRYPQDAGVFIDFGELLAIFPRIKRGEYTMNPAERQVLTKLEKVLYEYLTVEEVENLGAGEVLREPYNNRCDVARIETLVSGSRGKGEGAGR